MAEKFNKVALFIVLLIVIALIFGQFGFTKQRVAGNAQSSITVEPPSAALRMDGARASIQIMKTIPAGTAAAVITVQPHK